MALDPLMSTWLLAVGTVLVLVVVVAVILLVLTHRRRHRKVSVVYGAFGGQPFLGLAEKPSFSARKSFAEEFQVGTDVPVTLMSPGGDPSQHLMRVSRLTRLRAEAQGRVGESVRAFLADFEGTELPISLPVSANLEVVRLDIGEKEVVGLTHDSKVAWRSSWNQLRFVNPVASDQNQQLVLRSKELSELRLDPALGAGDYAEGLIIKYGKLAPRRTWSA